MSTLINHFDITDYCYFFLGIMVIFSKCLYLFEIHIKILIHEMIICPEFASK